MVSISTWVMILIMGVHRGGSAVSADFNSEETCKAALVAIQQQGESVKGSVSANGPGVIYGGCFRK